MKKNPFKPTFFTAFLTFWCIQLSLFSQKSYEFSLPVPVETAPVYSVETTYFGTYISTKGPQLSYELNEKGLFIHTINIQAISKETLRENSKYSIRNEHIFGVVEDSIPYVFQDDNYYFGVRNAVQLAGVESSNKLVPNGPGSYVLNFKTDNGYTPALLELKNKRVKENLEKTEQEMQSVLKSLMEKNETIAKMNEELELLFLKMDRTEEEHKHLTDKLQSFTFLTDVDRLQFKNHFEKRNPGFFYFFYTN